MYVLNSVMVFITRIGLTAAMALALCLALFSALYSSCVYYLVQIFKLILPQSVGEKFQSWEDEMYFRMFGLTIIGKRIGGNKYKMLKWRRLTAAIPEKLRRDIVQLIAEQLCKIEGSARTAALISKRHVKLRKMWRREVLLSLLRRKEDIGLIEVASEGVIIMNVLSICKITGRKIVRVLTIWDQSSKEYTERIKNMKWEKYGINQTIHVNYLTKINDYEICYGERVDVLTLK